MNDPHVQRKIAKSLRNQQNRAKNRALREKEAREKAFNPYADNTGTGNIALSDQYYEEERERRKKYKEMKVRRYSSKNCVLNVIDCFLL